MKKIDPTIIKETSYIGTVAFLFNIVMQSVFLIIGEWDYTVLLGGMLGFIASVGNFFLMGLSVQSAVSKDEKDAKNTMKLSQSMRLLFLFVIAVIAYVVPVFDVIAVIIPYIFPRLAIALVPILRKKR
jgi:glucose uptake protein GlcU